MFEFVKDMLSFICHFLSFQTIMCRDEDRVMCNDPPGIQQEPLDLSKHQEALKAGNNSLSKYSYHDLWTECCKRYQGIVQRALNTVDTQHLVLKDNIVPIIEDGFRAFLESNHFPFKEGEPLPISGLSKDVQPQRKRKHSCDSDNSSEHSDCSLPLKKRYLRRERDTPDTGMGLALTKGKF